MTAAALSRIAPLMIELSCSNLVAQRDMRFARRTRGAPRAIYNLASRVINLPVDPKGLQLSLISVLALSACFGCGRG